MVKSHGPIAVLKQSGWVPDHRTMIKSRERRYVISVHARWNNAPNFIWHHVVVGT